MICWKSCVDTLAFAADAIVRETISSQQKRERLYLSAALIEHFENSAKLLESRGAILVLSRLEFVTSELRSRFTELHLGFEMEQI
jgi:hypothetical protein